MAKLVDPIELYRAALADAPTAVEDRPPTIERAEVWPYPDLRRLWVRVQTTPFAAFPNLSLTVSDPDDQVVCTMFMVEIRTAYQSVTLHLRRPPQPAGRYRLALELARDEVTLDRREIEFELTYREPTADREGR